MCEFCTDYDIDFFQFGGKKFRYCPICGKKLNGEKETVTQKIERIANTMCDKYCSKREECGKLLEDGEIVNCPLDELF